MMLAADVPIAVGEKLEIALSDTVALRGEVVWSEAGRCGVSFDKEVDVAGMLKQLAAEQRANGYRQPRLSLQTKAEAVTDEGDRKRGGWGKRMAVRVEMGGGRSIKKKKKKNKK